jgi:alanine dehydrogenase
MRPEIADILIDAYRGVDAMRIGVPRETKVIEYRVGMVPDGVAALCDAGHEVWVEKGAGEGSGFADSALRERGARLVSREEAWSADLVVKVKDPLPDEVSLLEKGAVLFTYLHLPRTRSHAATARRRRDRDRLRDDPQPGRLVPGARADERGGGPARGADRRVAAPEGPRRQGILLGGVPGVMRGRVTVIGGGIVGVNAVRVAHALGAEVDVLDISLRRLTYLYDIFRGELNTLFANRGQHRALGDHERSRDRRGLPGGRRAPTLVTERMVRAMDAGSVIADVRSTRAAASRRSTHLPRRSHLRRARRDPLRRHEHAGRGAAHGDVRAHEHDAALRRADRGARRREGGRRRRSRSRRAPTSGAARSCTRASPSRSGPALTRPLEQVLHKH